MHEQSGGSHRRQSDPYQQPSGSHYDGFYRQPSDGYQRRVPAQRWPDRNDAQPGNYYQQPSDGYYQQQDYYRPNSYAPTPPLRKRRRVFMWSFFAVQALFIIWIIAGVVATGHTAPSAAEMAQYCGSGPKSVLALYQNKADCMTHYSRILSDAAGTGRGLGVALIIVFWIIVDFFLGLGYGIYRLATRSR